MGPAGGGGGGGLSRRAAGPRAGGGARPPRPKSPPIPRIVAGVTENEAVMLVRNGENLAVSEPTAPCHRSCVKARLNPGRRSDANVLLRVWVVQPVRLGCLACSKLYPMEEVLTLSRRILRGSRSVVSPGGGFNFASKFWDSPRLIVCCGSVRACALRPAGWSQTRTLCARC